MIYNCFIIYLIIIILYFERNSKDSFNNFGLFLLSVFVPIFGFIIAIMYYKNTDVNNDIAYEFEEMRDENVDDLDNFLLKGNHSNFSSELILNNYKQARKEIINFNKLSVNENCKLYMNALYSDDTEVSHMAAASLMKIKQQYESDLKLGNNTSTDYLENYVIKLDEYVKNGLIKGIIKDNLIINCINQVEKYVNFKSLKFNYFTSYVSLLLEINNYDLAKRYSYYVKDTWLCNEDAWYLLLNVLFKSKDNVELLNVINEYKDNLFEESERINQFISFWEENYEEEK